MQDVSLTIKRTDLNHLTMVSNIFPQVKPSLGTSESTSIPNSLQLQSRSAALHPWHPIPKGRTCPAPALHHVLEGRRFWSKGQMNQVPTEGKGGSGTRERQRRQEVGMPTRAPIWPAGSTVCTGRKWPNRTEKTKHWFVLLICFLWFIKLAILMI